MKGLQQTLPPTINTTRGGAPKRTPSYIKMERLKFFASKKILKTLSRFKEMAAAGETRL
jgi:hypothetical protein